MRCATFGVVVVARCIVKFRMINKIVCGWLSIGAKCRLTLVYAKTSMPSALEFVREIFMACDLFGYRFFFFRIAHGKALNEQRRTRIAIASVHICNGCAYLNRIYRKKTNIKSMFGFLLFAEYKLRHIFCHTMSFYGHSQYQCMVLVHRTTI